MSTATTFTSTSQHFSSKVGIGVKLFCLFGFLLVIASSVVYIFQDNAMTKEAYLVQNYQRSLSVLSQENMALEIHFSQANSLVSVDDLVKSLNFEKVDEVHYIKVLEGQVAKK